MENHSLPSPAERLAALERNLRRLRYGLVAGLLATAVAVMATWRKTASPTLRVRQIVVEDSLGHARVLLGAPLDLRLRVALGAPTPAPAQRGTVTARVDESAGVVMADTAGDERGGMGSFPDGRANVCLDYQGGVKEAACMFVYPDDQFAGILFNAPAGEGREQAAVVVGRDGLAQVKIAASGGFERAILKTERDGAAQLLVFDSTSRRFVDVLRGR